MFIDLFSVLNKFFCFFFCFSKPENQFRNKDLKYIALFLGFFLGWPNKYVCTCIEMTKWMDNGLVYHIICANNRLSLQNNIVSTNIIYHGIYNIMYVASIKCYMAPIFVSAVLLKLLRTDTQYLTKLFVLTNISFGFAADMFVCTCVFVCVCVYDSPYCLLSSWFIVFLFLQIFI